MTLTQLIQQGDRCTILALVRSGRCEITTFLDACFADNPTSAKHVIALFNRIADHGVPHNPEKFRKLKGFDNLYEMKVSNLRLFCFFDDVARRVVILTHGWKKGAITEQRAQVARANRLKDEYLRNR